MAVADNSTLLAFLSMFAIATAVVATAGRVATRCVGWSCGVCGTTSYVLYLMGISLVPWVYTLTAALALATIVTLLLMQRQTGAR